MTRIFIIATIAAALATPGLAGNAGNANIIAPNNYTPIPGANSGYTPIPKVTKPVRTPTTTIRIYTPRKR